eukprot:706006-Hanusia_phi.AAC.1
MPQCRTGCGNLMEPGSFFCPGSYFVTVPSIGPSPPPRLEARPLSGCCSARGGVLSAVTPASSSRIWPGVSPDASGTAAPRTPGGPTSERLDVRALSVTGDGAKGAAAPSAERLLAARCVPGVSRLC